MLSLSDSWWDGQRWNAVLSGERVYKPAGTGKTHTVRGILNVWHIVHYNRFLGSLVNALSRQDSQMFIPMHAVSCSPA